MAPRACCLCSWLIPHQRIYPYPCPCPRPAQCPQVPSLSPEALAQLWVHATAYVAEAVLEGIVRVKRCTLEGRAAMSVDLQARRGGKCPLSFSGPCFQSRLEASLPAPSSSALHYLTGMDAARAEMREAERLQRRRKAWLVGRRSAGRLAHAQG